MESEIKKSPKFSISTKTFPNLFFHPWSQWGEERERKELKSNGRVIFMCANYSKLIFIDIIIATISNGENKCQIVQ